MLCNLLRHAVQLFAILWDAIHYECGHALTFNCQFANAVQVCSIFLAYVDHIVRPLVSLLELLQFFVRRMKVDGPELKALVISVWIFPFVFCSQTLRGYFRNRRMLRDANRFRCAIHRKEAPFHDETGSKLRSLDIDRARAVLSHCRIQAEGWQLQLYQLSYSFRNGRLCQLCCNRSRHGRPKMEMLTIGLSVFLFVVSESVLGTT